MGLYMNARPKRVAAHSFSVFLLFCVEPGVHIHVHPAPCEAALANAQLGASFHGFVVPGATGPV